METSTVADVDEAAAANPSVGGRMPSEVIPCDVCGEEVLAEEIRGYATEDDFQWICGACDED